MKDITLYIKDGKYALRRNIQVESDFDGTEFPDFYIEYHYFHGNRFVKDEVFWYNSLSELLKDWKCFTGGSGLFFSDVVEE